MPFKTGPGTITFGADATVYISWVGAEPLCRGCARPWCPHVMKEITQGSDVIVAPGDVMLAQLTIPLAPRPILHYTHLPKCKVLLERHDDTVYVKLSPSGRLRDTAVCGIMPVRRKPKGLTYVVGGRRDIAEMIVPLLAAWYIEHPCKCETTRIGRPDTLQAAQQLAMRAAYRLMDDDLLLYETRCSRCDDSDLIPDVSAPKVRKSDDLPF